MNATMIDHAVLPTPAILIDRVKLAANLRCMQQVCDDNRVELRPHMKTHKMVEVARQQISGGARGLTCAKLGEAEAMLPSGCRKFFSPTRWRILPKRRALPPSLISCEIFASP